MNINKKLLVATFMTAVVSSSVGAFAATTLDFSEKAKTWTTANCTEKELNKKNPDIKDVVCDNYIQQQKLTSKVDSMPVTNSKPFTYSIGSCYVNIGPYTEYSLYRSWFCNETLIHNDGIISKIIVKDGNPNLKTIEGNTELEIYVNDKPSGFKIILDKDSDSFSKVGDFIDVKEGDIVKFQITNNVEEVEEDYMSANGEYYNIEVFMKS